MSAKRDEASAELIDKIVQHADGGEPDGSGAERAAPPDVAEFIRQYYKRVSYDDLAGRTVPDLYGAAVTHLGLARVRHPAGANVRVYNPDPDVDGWQSPHTVVDVVSADMPFLIDSMAAEITRYGLGTHLVIHPILSVRRDRDGSLVQVLPPQTSGEGVAHEAVIRFEIDRCSDADRRAALQDDLGRVLFDVRSAVEDWHAMRDRMLAVADDLEKAHRAADPGELGESADFLRWLAADHFTFIGARDYAVADAADGRAPLVPEAGSGLGIMRDDQGAYFGGVARVPADASRLTRPDLVVTLTKSHVRSTVHRPTHFDFIGVKRYDGAGRVVGERRFLGMYTADATLISPADIPLLRRKVQEVVKRSGFEPRSHDFKALIEIINNYPRDELLQVSPDDLYATTMGILDLQERPRVRLFARRDDFGRYVSCLVYVPRDRHTTAVRERMTAILQQAMDGVASDFTVRLTESPLARLHVVVYTDPARSRDYDVDEIETRLAEAARSWTDDLARVALDDYGEERGGRLLHRFGTAFPAAYIEDYPARAGAIDLGELEKLAGDTTLSMRLFVSDEPGVDFRFKLYRTGSPITLSDVLPVLENMGVRVVDERPYELDMTDGSRFWVYDFGLACGGQVTLGSQEAQQKFADAFAAIWSGLAENDGFNRLVLMAELAWRDIAVLRAFAKYLRQVGTAFSLDYMTEAVGANPGIARLVVELFHARLDPERREGSERRVADLTAEVERALDDVASLDEDRILRNFLRVVCAVLRTNYFQALPDGAPKPYLSFKLDPSQVPDAPLPLPLYEIWVYSPRVEGIHLRGGRVARGGIRWSDRREDFRTEVLGLMKAQMVKNTVIVPVGSKGGFVVKRPPAGGDRAAVTAEGVECYRTLIRGMLDVTDNLATGTDDHPRVVPPADVVRHDGDDPYLVVAADKGTATFSDIANALSIEYGYWLGDAFASGGSAGYDHKAMGITARGAWESVKRHFRELGHDTQTEDFTVVGIGDMSGDVFGNGMLLSRHIRLVAAFDHRHVFLDPDPDAAASFGERRRLFDLPRSSWADYDESLISAGGGIHPRSAKSVPISDEARRALGIAGDVTTLPPSELVRAILRAPVDLLWNGGIGTYVKASTETAADVGDRANDALRVDATELRCRVVGEGGNLGFTQRGRVEYALRGGRINTDAIDNVAGVDTSDHEVNIKILLDAVVRDGRLTETERDALLAEMTDEVAALVLRDNYDQTRALSNAVAQAPAMLGVHRRYISALERSGRLNRALEFLPDDDTLAARAEAGGGLTGPESAVLLAYSKMSFYDALLDSDVPEDPYLSEELVTYFPRPLRERFADAMRHHPLRREIIATCVTNRLINRAGMTFAFRMAEAAGAEPADVARAWTAAREMFDMPTLWSALDELDLVVPADVQTAMFLEARKLHDRATRWLVRNRRPPLDIAATVAHFSAGIATLTARLPDLMPASDVDHVRRHSQELVAAGASEPIATWVASCEYLDAAPDIVEAARDADRSVEDVARVYFELDERLELGWLHDEVAGLPRQGRWQTLARAAVRDDLYGVHAALTRDVLRVTERGTPPGACVERWSELNDAAVRRVTNLIGEIRAAKISDLATLSVALREVRSILATTA